MDMNHLNSTSSPVLGLSGNVTAGAKLKSNNNITASPGSANYNSCLSPLQGLSNNGRRSTSPYSSSYNESKTEDIILSKNGANTCLLGQNSNPFPSTEGSSIPPVSSASPSSATAAASARPSSGSTTHTKRDGIKITIRTNQNESPRVFNNYGSSPTSTDVKANPAISRRDTAGGRSEKLNPQMNNLHNDKLRNSTMARSISSSKSNRTNASGVNSTQARRYCSMEPSGHDRDTTSPANRSILNSSKFAEKGALRHSPRTPVEYLSTDPSGRSDNDSPFNSYPSPSSSESTLTTNTVRVKSKSSFGRDVGPGTPTVSSNAAHSNHRMSRTSSSNSVSDLSPCSEVTDETVTHGDGAQTNTPVANELAPSNIIYPSECNNTDTSINDLNIDNNLLAPFDDDIGALQSDKLRLSLEDIENFRLPDNANGSEDIGSNALNLSAEDIQETLNSVSAESGLTDIPIPQSTETSLSSVFNDSATLRSDILNSTAKNIINFDGAANTTVHSSDLDKILSPSLNTVSMAASTSSTTSVVTTAVSSAVDVTSTISKLASSTMTSSIASPSFGNDNFHSSSTMPTCMSSSTAVSYSPVKSHLQDILGITDTNRLKNMARPVDSAQYQSPTSTSFSTNLMKTNKSNPYAPRSSSISDRPSGGQMMSVTSPTPPMLSMSPRNRFGQPGVPNTFQRHPMHQRMPNPPHVPMSHGFDGMPSMVGPTEHSPGFGEHPLGMIPRPGMHYDQPGMPHPMQGNNMSYNIPSPQGMHVGGPIQRQRQGSMGSGMMSPHMIPMGDGSKSPRGQMCGFPPRPVNPMSGLQSTVDAIPNLSSMTKNNNNNMGPPHCNQGIPTPTGLEFGPLPSPLGPRTMLPPRSPSILHDKRSVSADGTLGTATTSRTKGSKRERGQSVDSKDGDKKGKDTGPKSKRRKSKSKDDSKKADSKANTRTNSVSDTQSSSYLYIFNSEMANKAASMVLDHSMPTIIHHHHRFQGNCRLLPSKAGSLPVVPSNHNFGLKSPNSQMAPSSQSNGRNEQLPTAQGKLPNVSSIVLSSTRAIKSEPPGMMSPNSTRQKSDETKSADGQSMKAIKSESDTTQESNAPTQSTSPATTTTAQQQAMREPQEEDLSDKQRKQREEKLNKISKLRKLFVSDHEQVQAPASSSAAGWQSTGNSMNKGGNYTMTRHLEKVQKMNKDNPMNASSTEGDWFRLVQAYNEEKRRTRVIQNNNPEGMPMEGMPPEPPPPYNPAAPGPLHQRWMGPGPPIREPGGPDIINSRYPHMGIGGQMRLPHDGSRYPAGYGQNRFPRGYIVRGGPGNRMPMYPGPNVPQSGLMARGPVPRIPQHGMGPPNESYPFSEKLKEQASIYRSEGMHGHQPGGPMGFEINTPGEPGMGPRMGSPEWPPYGNPGSMPLGGRLPRMPESISPTHDPMGGPGIMMPTPGSIPGQPMEPMTPVGEPTMDSNMGLRMNNPGMVPYAMTPYSGKGPNSLPTYPETSMPGMSPLVIPFTSQDMRPPSGNLPGVIISHDGTSHGGMMGDAMARRGEPRPPDLNINPGMSRSPPNFQGSRHPAPSPSMGPNPAMATPQYMPGELVPGVLPQVSPHHPPIPRSPMVNSPSMMKSPMGAPMNNQMQYMQMGPGGMQPMSVEQQSMMQPGPPSAGPTGTPADWGPISQPSMAPRRTPSSGGLMQSNPGQKPAILQMIDRVNRFQLPNALYQNEVKDTASPPPLTHMNGNPMSMQEPPPLTHHPSHLDPNNMPVCPTNSGVMIRTPGGNMISQLHPITGGPPGYDPNVTGPRSAGGQRPMGGMVGDGYGGDFNRPPSQPTMCMSPTMQGMPHNMMQPGLIEMHGPPSGYISQSNMMPGVPAGMPGHPGSGQPPNPRGIPEFDLTGIIPSEKPSQTLSYFPSGGGNIQDTGQMDSAPNMSMRSPPPMPQQSMNRFQNVNMNQRPITPGHHPYMGNNPAMRMPGPGAFMVSNPPSYPGPATEGYMSPSWDPMSGNRMARPQGMPNSVPNMHPGFQNGRPLI